MEVSLVDDETFSAEKVGAGVKLQDIASTLNLSVATVSRALRKIPGINPETRARVMQSAAQLGYHTAKTYRSKPLNSVDLHHIGVLVNTPLTQVTAPYLTGMADAAITLNAALMVHYVRPETCEKILSTQFQPVALRSGLLSGFILVFRWPDSVVRKLSHMLPTVSIVHKYSDADVDLVGLDNEEGVEILVRHLHGLGHRQIGFFGRSK